MSVILQPIQQLPFLYVNGMGFTWVSNTTITIANGRCRDSTNNCDIVVEPTASSTTTLNFATSGLNGLDTGSIDATKDYAVYAIINQLNNSTGFLASLNVTGTPLLPYGYNLSRRIGWLKTDGSSHLRPFTCVGNNSTKQYQWGTAISVYGGFTAATFTAQVLTAGMPPVAIPVSISSEFEANVAGDGFYLRPTGSAISVPNIFQGNALSTGTSQLFPPAYIIPSLNVSGIPSIDIKGDSASDVLNLYVNGFIDYL